MGDLIPEGLGPLRTRILQVALGELGARESPMGSNRGPRIDKYLPAWAQKRPGPPWCAFFACWVLKEALGEVPMGIYGGNSLNLMEDAEEKGLWKPKASGDPPVPGDVGIMDVGEPGNDGHTFLVLRVSFDATLTESIEGNSGNRVRVGKRDVADPRILGFIHTVSGERADGYKRGLSGKGADLTTTSTR